MQDINEFGWKAACYSVRYSITQFISNIALIEYLHETSI